MTQMVKNQPAMKETWVQSLDWEDPLEKVMATHSSILAWRISWTLEPGGLQSMESQRDSTKGLKHTQQAIFYYVLVMKLKLFSYSYILRE